MKNEVNVDDVLSLGYFNFLLIVYNAVFVVYSSLLIRDIYYKSLVLFL